MRTTLNLDDDVAAALSHDAGREGRSMSRVANDLIRAGLRARHERARTEEPYVPPVVDTGRPRVDVTDIGEVLEILDGE